MIALKTNPKVTPPGPKEQQQRDLAAARRTEANTTPTSKPTAPAAAKPPKEKPPVKTKPKAKAKPKAAKKAKKTAKPKTAKTTEPRADGLRPGSKVAIVAGLLQRAEGTTTAEVLKETGWPSVSMPQQATAAGIELKQRKEGKVTRYWSAEFYPGEGPAPEA